jgi:hypothetical protein
MNDLQVSGADTRAICKEIGERLRGFATASDQLSPRLRSLMEQMARADGKSFATVPR